MLHDVVNLNHKSGYFYGKQSWMMNVCSMMKHSVTCMYINKYYELLHRLKC